MLKVAMMVKKPPSSVMGSHGRLHRYDATSSLHIRRGNCSSRLQRMCWPPPCRLFPHPLWFHKEWFHFRDFWLFWTFCLYWDRTVRSGRKWGKRWWVGNRKWAGHSFPVGTWTQMWYRQAATCIIAPPHRECFLMQLHSAGAMLTNLFDTASQSWPK